MVLPKIGEFLFGKKDKTQQLPTLTPEQQQQLSGILGITQEQLPGMMEQLGQFDIGEQAPYQQAMPAIEQLLGGFDPAWTTEAFQAGVAQPAIQQFQEQIAPAIQERAIGSGAGRGSAMQRQLATAGSNLESSLSGQLSQMLLGGEQMGQQAQLGALGQALGYAQAPQAAQITQLQPLLQMLGIGMGTSPYENIYQPASEGAMGPILAALIGTGGKVGAAAM